MRIRPAALGVALLATLTACTGSGSHRTTSGPPTSAPPPSSTVPVIDTAPSLPRLAVGARLWDTKSLGLTRAFATAAGGDIVVDGAGKDDQNLLVVVDASTGKSRWRLPFDTQLRPGMYFWNYDAVIGTGANRFVLVEWDRADAPDDAADRYGFAALRVKDGSIAWTLSPQRGWDSGDHWKVLVSPDGGTAFVTVLRQYYDEDGAKTHTWAVDAANGKVRWTRHGLQGEYLAGDVLVGPELDTGTRDGDPAMLAVDAKTGTPLWHPPSPSADGQSGLAYVVGEHLIYRGRSGNRSTWTVRAARDGRAEPLHLPSGVDVATVSDDQTLLAAEIFEDGGIWRLVTFSAADAEPYVSAHQVPGRATIEQVVGGYILMSQDGGTTYVALDRSGNVLGGPLPGRVELLGQKIVLISTGTGIEDRTVTAYRRG